MVNIVLGIVKVWACTFMVAVVNIQFASDTLKFEKWLQFKKCHQMACLCMGCVTFSNLISQGCR